MNCLKPFHLVKQGFSVPCGMCLACKQNRRLDWANRLMMERMYWNDACFVTLTYDEAHLSSPTLVSEDLQKFFKRVRRDLPKDFKIKYYACGEYGSKYGRPHYHAIIFGLSPVHDRELIKENWPFADWQSLEETERGRKAIGTCTFGSCFYVAGYINKKLVGKVADDVYASNGLLPPFNRMSKGLGLQFALDNKDILTKTLQVNVGGYRTALSHYFRDKLGVTPEEMKQRHFDHVFDQISDVVKRHQWLKGASVDTLLHVYDVESHGQEFRKNALQRGMDLRTKLAFNSDNEFDPLDL